MEAFGTVLACDYVPVVSEYICVCGYREHTWTIELVMS